MHTLERLIMTKEETAQWTRDIHYIAITIGKRCRFIDEVLRPHNHRMEWVDGVIRTLGMWY